MNKISNITIKNFQSIKDADIPVGQFTSIVGASNLGKSAILRALRLTARNGSAPGLVRQGEKQLSVAVEFDDNTSVGVTKGAKISEFKVNEDVYAKAGANTVPEPVEQLWNVADLSFMTQHDKPFLLDESPSEVARTLGELTNAAMLMEAVREANRLRLEAANEAKVRTREAEECKTQLLTHQGFNAKLEATRQVRELFDQVKQLTEKLSQLKKLSQLAFQIDLLIEEKKQFLEQVDNFSSLLVKIDAIIVKSQTVSKLLATKKFVTYNINYQFDLLEKYNVVIEELEQQIHKELKDAGVCPVCNQEIK